MGGGVQDGVPYHGEEKAAVEVHVGGPLLDLDGFCRPSLPEPYFLSPHCCSFPLDAVVGFLHGQQCHSLGPLCVLLVCVHLT